ncbi:CHAD domain-containing protein [Gaoshiqia sp. Z1-71]|uniref:CHAD domain-containing protein n=1 Tax=Gaoshiqia hydrogeniformans TaxID=3290090 RepID=UPI003BF89936
MDQFLNDMNKQFALFNRCLDRVQANAGVEDVHKLRVVARKLRTLLSVLDFSGITVGAKEEYQKLINRLFLFAGRVREAQVNELALSRRKADYLASYLNYLRGAQKRAIRFLQAEINAFDRCRLEQLGRTCLQGVQSVHNDGPVAAVSAYIAYKQEKICLLKQAVTDDRLLHKIRIQLKALSDGLILHRKVNGRDLAGVPTPAIKKINRIMGNWHDEVVLTNSLKLFVKRRTAQKNKAYLENLIDRKEKNALLRRTEICSFLDSF